MTSVAYTPEWVRKLLGTECRSRGIIHYVPTQSKLVFFGMFCTLLPDAF